MTSHSSPGGNKIELACSFLDKVKETIRQKNLAYGNSAFDPVRIFSSAHPEEGIRVRIDDKLSRIARGHSAEEDVILDLVGYLAILWAMQ
jgi:hypothetical protein